RRPGRGGTVGVASIAVGWPRRPGDGMRAAVFGAIKSLDTGNVWGPLPREAQLRGGVHAPGRKSLSTGSVYAAGAGERGALGVAPGTDSPAQGTPPAEGEGRRQRAGRCRGGRADGRRQTAGGASGPPGRDGEGRGSGPDAAAQSFQYVILPSRRAKGDIARETT